MPAEQHRRMGESALVLYGLFLLPSFLCVHAFMCAHTYTYTPSYWLRKKHIKPNIN